MPFLRPCRRSAGRFLVIFALLAAASVGLGTSAQASTVRNLVGYGCKLYNIDPYYRSGYVIFNERIQCAKVINGMELHMTVGWAKHAKDGAPIKHRYYKQCLSVKTCGLYKKVRYPQQSYYYTQFIEDYYTNPKAGVNAYTQDRIEDFIG